MAITRIEYELLARLADRGALSARPRILELGQANWYGDVPFDLLRADIVQRVKDPAGRRGLLRRLDDLLDGDAQDYLFGIADVFWEVFFAPSELAAIDLGGAARSLKLDLNAAVDLGRRFDLVTNFGTAEHVFNVLAFFKTVHDHAETGAVMVHDAPFSGWADHGFFNFQPTFWLDLAEANGYEVLGLHLAGLEPFFLDDLSGREEVAARIRERSMPTESLLCAVFRKAADRPFVPPMQAYYAGSLPEDAARAWMEARVRAVPQPK